MSRKTKKEQSVETSVPEKPLSVKERLDNLTKSREQMLHGLSKIDGAIEMLNSLIKDGEVKNG